MLDLYEYFNACFTKTSSAVAAVISSRRTPETGCLNSLQSWKKRVLRYLTGTLLILQLKNPVTCLFSSCNL